MQSLQICETMATERIEKGNKKTMQEHKLAINFDADVTVSDLLEEKTLDVSSLKLNKFIQNRSRATGKSQL